MSRFPRVHCYNTFMNNPNSKFEQLARQALKEYELGAVQLEFIQQSDNVSYRVDSEHGPLALLRIHSPVTPIMGNHGANMQMVLSEMFWLEALAEKTDIPTPRPYRNKSHAFVTAIPAENGQVYHCSVLGWLDGELYCRDLESEETAVQVGQIAGKLHRFASRWRIPRGFSRPLRDAAYFETMLAHLDVAVQDGRIAVADFSKLQEALSLLLAVTKKVRQGRQLHGLLHGDMHKGNFLYDQGKIKIIDFSFCSFGHYLFDLAICISDTRRDLRPTVFDTYRQSFPLPQNAPRLLEGYYIGSMIGTLAMLVDRPELELQENLVRRVPILAQEFAARFIRGEHFWATDLFQDFPAE